MPHCILHGPTKETEMVLIQKWERQRGRNKRWKGGEKRGEKDRKHLEKGGEMTPDNMCVVYLCICVCHGLSVSVSVSHNQGQVACRQFIPVGPSQQLHKTLSLLFAIRSPLLCSLSLSFSIYFLRLFHSSFPILEIQIWYPFVEDPFRLLVPSHSLFTAKVKKMFVRTVICLKRQIWFMTHPDSFSLRSYLAKTFILKFSHPISVFLNTYVSVSWFSHMPSRTRSQTERPSFIRQSFTSSSQIY